MPFTGGGGSTSPITMTNGTLETQLGVAYWLDFIQRLQMALVVTSEYIIKIESSSDPNYADLAHFARMAATSPVFWAQVLAPLIAMDPTMTISCTDQQMLNRVWTAWPVFSYLAATVPYFPDN